MARSAAFGSFVGLGRQSVLGTTVSRTIFMSPVSEDLKFMPNYDFPDQLRTPSAPRGVLVAGGRSEGPITVGMSFTGHETLLKDLFGGVATSTLGSGAKQHDFTLATALPSPGLSVEIKRGSSLSTSFLHADCKINKGTFRFSPRKEVEAIFEFLGRAVTTPSASSPSFITHRPIPPPITTLTIDGSAVDLDGIEVTIDNALLGADSIVSSTIREPLRNGMRVVTLSFEKDFETVAASSIYDKFKTGVNAAVVIEVTGAVFDDPDAYKFRLSLPQVKFVEASPTVAGVGLIKKRVQARAIESATDAQDEISAQLVNDTASVT